MNSSILISRRLLQTTDVPETSPTAAGSPHRPWSFDSSMASLILIAFSYLFCLGYLCLKNWQSGGPEEDDSPSDRRRPRRADVNSLPLIPYGRTARQRIMIDDCPICLTEFREGESVKLIPRCGHVFHPRCLDTWLASHVTCPLCRCDELFVEGEEVCLDVAPE